MSDLKSNVVKTKNSTIKVYACITSLQMSCRFFYFTGRCRSSLTGKHKNPPLAVQLQLKGDFNLIYYFCLTAMVHLETATKSSASSVISISQTCDDLPACLNTALAIKVPCLFAFK